MKFYEFNNYEYYALIGAENESEAIKFYRLNIANIEIEKDESPEEITKESTWNKFKEALENELIFLFEEDMLKDFNYQINNKSPILLLMDKSL
ncbi:hypothetical protein [Fusobacterium varium]